MAGARDLTAGWPSLTQDEKRKIVEAVTERIEVGDGDITIQLCYLPSPAELATKRQRNLIV